MKCLTAVFLTYACGVNSVCFLNSRRLLRHPKLLRSSENSIPNVEQRNFSLLLQDCTLRFQAVMSELSFHPSSEQGAPFELRAAAGQSRGLSQDLDFTARPAGTHGRDVGHLSHSCPTLLPITHRPLATTGAHGVVERSKARIERIPAPLLGKQQVVLMGNNPQPGLNFHLCSVTQMNNLGSGNMICIYKPDISQEINQAFHIDRNFWAATAKRLQVSVQAV